MLTAIWDYLNLTQVFVVLTAVNAALFPWKKNALLCIIILVSLTNETISLFFLNKPQYLGILITVSSTIHNSLWLFLMYTIIGHRKLFFLAIPLSVAFSIVNAIFFNKTGFAYDAFILSSFIYLTIFIIESLRQLQRENFVFFTDASYLLLVAPVMFFLGLSFIFGFKSHILSSTYLFGKYKLYDFICTIVNFIYYLFVNQYIIKQKRHAK